MGMYSIWHWIVLLVFILLSINGSVRLIGKLFVETGKSQHVNAIANWCSIIGFAITIIGMVATK